MFDVCIIGAGIVGTAVARKLSQYNLKIILLEKQCDVAMGATKANSAIVHGGFAESNSKLKGRLCYQGRKQFEELNNQLNFGFNKIGSLVVTHQQEDLPALQRLLENGIKNGLSDLSILNREQILQREPNLNPQVQYALYCEGAGVCSPYEMAIALAENAVANGVQLRLNTPVTAMKKTQDGFAVQTPQGEIAARYVINCAGLESATVNEMLNPQSFTIHPRSGEYLLFARGTGAALNHVIFQMPTKMGKGVLATSTYYGNMLIGPDAIDEPGQAERSTHLPRLEEIYRQALSVTEKIDPAQFIRSFTGLRAVSSTDDFVVEQSATNGLINVAGIQSPGVTASPAIADMVAQLLKDAGLQLSEREDFNPNRKPIVSKQPLRPFAEVAPLLKEPPRPERIICRCEQVTQAQIADAFSRGIPIHTVDAIKRRTRASMGFCQGEFCRPRILELAETVLGHTIDAHTDVQREGVTRVERKQVVTALKEVRKQTLQLD